MRINKPWMTLQQAQQTLHGHMGIFQLADNLGEVIFIGYAGGNSKFGLKGEVAAAAKQHTDVVSVRVEITTAYLSRFKELMMIHVADHGSVPKLNPPIQLGRLSPAGPG